MIKRILHLGLHPPQAKDDEEVIHFPVIATKACHPDNPDIRTVVESISEATHLIFTSKTAVTRFCDLIPKSDTLADKHIITVGRATAAAAEKSRLPVSSIAKRESAEGVVEVLQELDLTNAMVLWPHSAQARSVITDYLDAQGIRYNHCALYSVTFQQPYPKPSLQDITAISFTSPSTVDGFFKVYETIPAHVELHCIGPVTQSYLTHRTGFGKLDRAPTF